MARGRLERDKIRLESATEDTIVAGSGFFSKLGVYSLFTPPVQRCDRWKWMAYAILGGIRILFFLPLGVGLILLETGKSSNIALVDGSVEAATAVSMFSLFIGAVSDYTVFFCAPAALSQPDRVPLAQRTLEGQREPFCDYGEKFFQTKIAKALQAHSYVTRLAQIAFTLMIVLFAVPPSNWRTTECSETSQDCSLRHLRVQKFLFSMTLISTLIPSIVLCLWSSGLWVLYFILGQGRLIIGALCASISFRFLTGLVDFFGGYDSDFNALNPDVQGAAKMSFSFMVVNGGGVGIISCLTAVFSLVVAWKRSKYLMVIDTFVQGACILIFAAGITSVGISWQIESFFCNYDDFFEPAAIAEDICIALSQRTHFARVQWLIVICFVFTCLHIGLGVIFLFIKRCYPVEWALGELLDLGIRGIDF